MFRVIAGACVLLFNLAAAVAGDSGSGEGVVNKVKIDDKKLNITHGPIKGVMGGMTMDFPVADPAMLDGVSAGSKIRFAVEKDRGGNFVITDLQVMT
jgi:Cu/Ag efflux protein CusF